MKKLFLLFTLAMLSLPALSKDCDYSYGLVRDGDWWRPVFTREPCNRSLKITYRVAFPDGSSSESRFVYIMSSSFSATARGSERYDRRGDIKILGVERGDPEGNSTSSSSRRTGTNSTSSPRSTGTNSNNTLKEALAEAGGAAALMAVVAIIVGSNDLYAHWITSQDYSGYNFGFKNTMSRRLDIEAGFGMYKAKKETQAPAGFFRTDYAYNSQSFDWGFEMNAVYNLSPRRWIVNPYAGIGTMMLNSSFALGGIAGLSAGVWDDRLQLHIRYKWLKDFDYPKVMTNQIELGLSVKYKRGWGFSDQHFYDPEDYREGGVHFAMHAGLSTASASAKIEDRSVSLKSRTGYNLMLYMAANVAESLWAINWGIIGVGSLGWQMDGIQQNLYYLPMSLGTSYQINIPVDFLPLSILPSVGLQWGFLTDSNYDTGVSYKTDLTKFDIGPSLGAALRIDNTLEFGAQYDIGLINVFKQGDESNRNGWKFHNRNLQFFTRVFF
jgi:hypothetical protein